MERKGKKKEAWWQMSSQVYLIDEWSCLLLHPFGWPTDLFARGSPPSAFAARHEEPWGAMKALLQMQHVYKHTVWK